MSADVVKFVGNPTGPKVLVPELGTEVPTFEEEPGGKLPALRHHVPLNCRGPFRPEQLANYSDSTEYRTDKLGWLLCYEKTQAEEFCKRRAVNRFPRCNFHGGRVHPLDKLIDPTSEDKGPDEPAALSRYQQYMAKQIGVDDLDDEEIMAFGFRDGKGHIFKPKNITREMVQAFTKSIFERSLDQLKTNALQAVKTLTSIMMDPQVDAPVRAKCATEILDRTLGKAPQTVNLVGNMPWEEVMLEGIENITRAESRKRRGTVIDAEVVGDDVSQDDKQPTTRNLMKEIEDGRT